MIMSYGWIIVIKSSVSVLSRWMIPLTATLLVYLYFTGLKGLCLVCWFFIRDGERMSFVSIRC